MRYGVTLLLNNHSDWDRFKRGEHHEGAFVAPVGDDKLYEQELALGKLVEPLGFDSLWTVEHHFTPYTMIPDPLQFLSYFAGQTERIDMGTMVVVLPWWDPLRVAEKVSMLDHMLGGRRLFLGLGRGAGVREFTGFEMGMDDTRERFAEGLDVLRRALGEYRFSYDGSYRKFDELELRPRPLNPARLLDDLYLAWGSPPSAVIGGELGLKPLVIPMKDWEEHAEEVNVFAEARAKLGLEPAKVKIFIWCFISEDETDLEEMARKHYRDYDKSVISHYQFDQPHMAKAKGYEYYADAFKDVEADSKDEQREFVGNELWGTPEQCAEKLARVITQMDPDEVGFAVKWGDITLEEGERSLHLLAEKVLPAVKELIPTAA